MKARILSILLLGLLLFMAPQAALAQTYRFSLDKETVHVYWNARGDVTLDYTFTFTNDPSADPLDAVDVGAPNTNYDLGTVSADMDGVPLTRIENSPYVTGAAVYLESHAIPPGGTGTVHVKYWNVRKVLYPDDKDKEYVSAVFSPTWFGSEYVQGSTDLTVVYHLPPGVQPEEPRWHAAPAGFNSEPETGLDENGFVTYTWHNPQASPSTQYKFGASFPARLVPETAVTRPDPWEPLYAVCGWMMAILPCVLFMGAMIGFISLAAWSAKKRSMAYLPPSISIEGHGIKRGLTPVEAAVVMEQPIDKIMTMILFSTIKKNAAKVIQRDPLKIEPITPKPEGLFDYETKFIEAFGADNNKKEQRKTLQTMMVDLVRSVTAKMKGFSRKETVAYYKSIMEKAWQQIEAAETPEVKSAKFDEDLDWTMLDKNYEDRTREVFRTQPVFLPRWWGNYDPTWQHSSGTTPHMASPTAPSSQPSSGGGGFSMPTLSGADFAAGMVLGAQNFAGDVVGNVTDFTGRITDVTNPVPKSTGGSRSGGGGGGCACACACAGCACACAGGGR